MSLDPVAYPYLYRITWAADGDADGHLIHWREQGSTEWHFEQSPPGYYGREFIVPSLTPMEIEARVAARDRMGNIGPWLEVTIDEVKVSA